jgi:ABC-2 type transport system ATP-binding protein
MTILDKVSFNYGNKQILKDISISFEEANVHGIVGLNGAGKTTFFNLLCGYEKASEGKIIYNNHPIIKNKIGFMETENYFYPKLTARDFLNIFTQTNTSFNQDKLVEIFNLPLDELIQNYSTGMKKKLMLLSYIKQDKQIYVLDEPFNGLDLEANKTLEIIIDLLKQKGKTIFISSHIIDPLLNVCDKIYYLSEKTFTKTYQKKEFHLLEEEVFGKLKSKLKTEIDLAL